MQELGLVEVINHNQEVAKWVRSWSVLQLGPVEKIGYVVDASFAFYNESVMSSSSSSWASLFAFI